MGMLHVGHDRQTPSRARLPGVLVATVLVALLLGPLLASPAALADDAFRMGTQIEDRAGVLGDREAEVQHALDELQGSERVQLWLAYVDTFSGTGAQDWADETAAESDFGLNDVLLAIAVEDRAYAYSVDQDFALSQEQMDEIMITAVEPPLSQNDWAGGGVGAAQGITQALNGQTVTTPDIQPGPAIEDGATRSPALLPALLVVVAVVALALWAVLRRRRKREGAGPEGAAQQVDLDELRREASRQLVETDDAVKTSTQEVGFATAQFGEEQAAPFQRALDAAKRELDEAFRLHKQLDDDDGEVRQRELLTEVLAHTAAANEKLDAQAERFDRLRDLEKDAPHVLEALGKQLAGLEERLPQVRDEIAALAAEYSVAALSPVAANPDEAASRISFSREQVAGGRDDLAAGRSGEAAVAALAAQEAAAQAEALLDAVGRRGNDLAEARERIDDAIAEAQRDIAEAQASGAAARLASLIATAETAIAAAATAASREGGRDPLASLRHLEEADAALETALVDVRDEQARRAKAAAALERTLLAARAQVSAAADFITTHRGVVGSGPRTLLAQAQGDLDQAVALGDSDPVTAARHAASAHELAQRALDDAQDEAGQTAGMPGMPGFPGSRGGSDIGGAIIGGILAGMLSGGLGGGRSGGGFGGGGGFGPPSFGGGGTRMRRGGGGRF